MRNEFPVFVCVIGAIANFVLWAKLRNFKVRENPPASRAGLSIEEQQRKIAIGRGIVFGLAWFMLAGALLLAWLGRST